MKNHPKDTWELANELERLAKSLKKAPKLILSSIPPKIKPESLKEIPEMNNYNSLKVGKLKQLCKDYGIKLPRGYVKKDILIEKLREKNSKQTTIEKITSAFKD